VYVDNAAPHPPTGTQQGGVLSYVTDESGLVMTGVWSAQSNTGSSDQNVQLPEDFTATGGGLAGSGQGGPVLIGSNLDSNSEIWIGQGVSSSNSPQVRVTTYTIGLKIEGLPLSALMPTNNGGSSSQTQNPSLTVKLDLDRLASLSRGTAKINQKPAARGMARSQCQLDTEATDYLWPDLPRRDLGRRCECARRRDFRASDAAAGVCPDKRRRHHQP